jgi:uncharacterized protein
MAFDSNPTYKQLNSILVKPAGPDCNMQCTYCFYVDKARLYPEVVRHRMNDNVLEEMIRQVMEQSGPGVSFCWQGGEPTLMGVPFFEKVVNYQQKYNQGQHIENSIQTNGILINKKWAEFLKFNDFLVGISLDGPKHINDYYRLLSNGKGSWQYVVENIQLLLNYKVQVNVLSVINDYSSQFPKEIYEFFKQLGLNYMQFIPCLEFDQKSGHPSNYSVQPEKYGEFLCQVFDMWKGDFKDGIPTTFIRLFESVFFYYVGLQSPECVFSEECGNYLVVEHNGDVYACDFFVEPGWKIGNLLKENLIEMLNSPRQNEFGKLKSLLPTKCKDCQWLSYCRGGCTKNRKIYNSAPNINYFCSSYRMFFQHADEEMKKLAEKWHQQQATIMI